MFAFAEDKDKLMIRKNRKKYDMIDLVLIIIIKHERKNIYYFKETFIYEVFL